MWDVRDASRLADLTETLCVSSKLTTVAVRDDEAVKSEEGLRVKR